MSESSLIVAMGNWWSSPKLPDEDVFVIPNRVVDQARQGDVYLVMFSQKKVDEELRLKRAHHALILDLAGQSDENILRRE